MSTIRQALTQKNSQAFLQMLRYGAVVVIAAPIDLGGLILLKSVFHVQYVLAATISFTVSLLVNYLLSARWVFDTNTGRSKTLDAGAFAVIGVVGLGITDLVIWFCTSVLSIHYVISKLIAFAIVFFWSFGARRWLFNRKKVIEA